MANTTEGMTDTIQKISEKCIQANPEVFIGLKPGGRVQRGKDWPIDTVVTIHVDMEKGLFDVLLCREKMNITFDLRRLTREEIEDWRVVARTIRLADVLLAMSATGQYGICCSPLPNTDICELMAIVNGELIKTDWQLLKDFEDQSQETIAFIGKVLGV